MAIVDMNGTIELAIWSLSDISLVIRINAGTIMEYR